MEMEPEIYLILRNSGFVQSCEVRRHEGRMEEMYYNTRNVQPREGIYGFVRSYL